MDYAKLYDLEKYLFSEVSKKFQEKGQIEAFDFFCIIIWKANRAKSKIAKKLLDINSDLDKAAIEITKNIFEGKTDKDRLSVLIKKYGFRLPMASAILTVFYPEEFTVYDVRVCEILNDFQNLDNKINFESIWNGYDKYRETIIKKEPNNLTLREKDRYFWGESFYRQLNNNIERAFKHINPNEINE